MASEGKAPDVRELFRKWVYDRLGIPGLVLLVVLAFAGTAWLKWDDVKKWILAYPGVADVILPPPPRADPKRFSIMVAHLEKDTEGQLEHLIVEDLARFKGIQVLALDRVIPLGGPIPEQMETRGHDRAANYLKQTGASVLIWGSAIRLDKHVVPQLYWTAAGGAQPEPTRYDAPKPEDRLRLPAVFWTDLSKILGLMVTSRDTEFRSKDGHYIADQLQPFIDQVRTLLKASVNREGWDADERASTRVILADALQVLGDQRGENGPLEEAVEAYREALTEYTRERVPLAWATTQNNLGNALSRIGERESGTDPLEQAVEAYQEALKEYTRERVPLDWAMTQNNLGNALSRIGERESGTDPLAQAVEAYQEALKEYTRERVPLQWATTQNNLGTALQSLGEREAHTGRLEQAVEAYRAALQERTRERVPLDWAMTQNNLGSALQSLGERETGTDRLEQAVEAYKEALKERTRERLPLDWAGTQNNLGSALRNLGERESGTERLEQAVAAYKAALGVVEPAQASRYIEMFRANLQRVQSLLDQRKKP